MTTQSESDEVVRPEVVRAAPCIAAFCASCGHAHDGETCNTHVVVGVVDHPEIGLALTHEVSECGCETFVKIEPTQCVFHCGCNSPNCDCTSGHQVGPVHCALHAAAIMDARNDDSAPDEVRRLAAQAHHPHD